MNQKELVRLIRRLAREEANEVVDEHLSDFVHVEKPLEEGELEAERC